MAMVILAAQESRDASVKDEKRTVSLEGRVAEALAGTERWSSPRTSSQATTRSKR